MQLSFTRQTGQRPLDLFVKVDGIYEHLDSYGNKPDKTLGWVNMQVRGRPNEATPYLIRLLLSKRISTISSNIKIAAAMRIRQVRVLRATLQTEE